MRDRRDMKKLARFQLNFAPILHGRHCPAPVIGPISTCSWTPPARRPLAPLVSTADDGADHLQVAEFGGDVEQHVLAAGNGQPRARDWCRVRSRSPTDPAASDTSP